MKKIYLSAFLIVSFISYFVWTAFFAKGDDNPNINPSTKNVKTIVAATSDFTSTKIFSGFIGGVRQADVSPKAGGYVTKLLKEGGDSVRAGETIAVLDGSELAAMDQSALMSLDAIKKTLGDTKDFYDQKVDEAEAMLKKTKESYSHGDVTKKDIKIGEEAVKSAKQMRDLQNSGAKANVAAAQGGALVAHVAAKDATIAAPFAGVITRKYSSVGFFAAPGTPLYAISSPSDMEISISIPGSVSDLLSKNSEVFVYPEGQQTSSVQGYVFSVSQAVGAATQKSIVRIRFSDAQKNLALTLGQFVNVSVPLENSRTAILIPEEAILREYDDTFVFSLSDSGIVKKKKVTIGEASGDLREVLSGIESGERIVIGGQYLLRDGESVIEGK